MGIVSVMRVMFTAFDNGSSDVYQRTVIAENKEELESLYEVFRSEVPFPSFFTENELLEGEDYDLDLVNEL